MVRSMYSGVAGMKVHQTRMDTIGNNIANVNTYGFKSSRVSFRDVYYQNMKAASGASSNKGGTNPTQIGYGAMLGQISVNQGTSTMQNTGNGLDVAISGEGFFQVMDTDGNIFYTKAGMLDVDSGGNLVDVNGNFVLGVSGDPVGKAAGSNRITLNVPSVNPSVSSYEVAIQNTKYSISSSNKTTDANVTINFASTDDLPIGQKVEAIITSSGVTVRLNSKEEFASLADMQNEINKAITTANGGVAHPAGNFEFTMNPDPFTAAGGPLTGAEIAGSNFGVNKGSVPEATGDLKGLVTIKEVGDAFSAVGAPDYTITKVAGPPVTYDFTIEIDGTTYEATGITSSQMESAGTLLLKNSSGHENDTITITYPSEKSLNFPQSGIINDNTNTALSVASTPSKDLGLGSEPFKLTGGTKGGTQTVADLTGIAIGPDGVITATHATHGLMELGRIDIATFANSKGLEQTGSTYFKVTANSGTPIVSKPGENGTGALSSGSLEMSNVDLSNEFADMITTQRGFQANSRMITVSDTMLEELINLKR